MLILAMKRSFQVFIKLLIRGTAVWEIKHIHECKMSYVFDVCGAHVCATGRRRVRRITNSMECCAIQNRHCE